MQQRTAWVQLVALPHHTEQIITDVCQRVLATPVRGTGPLAVSDLTESIPSPIGWMGAKASIAHHIVGLLPKHDTFIEPFLGGGSILLAKPKSRIELVNDIHGEIVNFFHVLRDEQTAACLKRLLQLTSYSRAEHEACCNPLPVEDVVEGARRFFVAVRQSFGSAEDETRVRLLGGGDRSPTRKYCNAVDRLDLYAERLRHVQIECRDFRDLLARCDRADVCVYADPPYLQDTRHQNGSRYRHEMSEKDHGELLDILCGFKRAHVVLSATIQSFTPQALPSAVASMSGGLPTIGTSTGQINPDGVGAMPVSLTQVSHTTTTASNSSAPATHPPTHGNN